MNRLIAFDADILIFLIQLVKFDQNSCAETLARTHMYTNKEERQIDRIFRYKQTYTITLDPGKDQKSAVLINVI